MTGSLVGNVTDVRSNDNPPSCLVRNPLTGRDAWYRVSARVTPPIRVGEWVRVVSGGDPDASGAADFEPQVVDRADQPAPSSPLPVAAEMHQLDSARGMNDEPGALTDGELETIRRYVEHCVRGELHALVELRGKGVGYLARLLGEVDRLRERKREARG